jgi:signal transduction histidine kinase
VNTLGTGAGTPDGRVGRDPPSQARLNQLADEQAALRRVATLVARGEPPEVVFAAVAEEVGQLLRVDLANLFRYEPDRSETSVAAWGLARKHFPVGSRWPLTGHNLSTLVFETSHPVRVDHYADSSSGALGAPIREMGIRSAVGAPILVEGSLWGAILAGSTVEQPLPADTESRLASFTEFVATAIANTDSRTALGRLAEEQAALRRVATLVARATPPAQVFAAVAEEVGRVLAVDFTILVRYDTQDTLEVVGTWTRTGAPAPTPVGGRLPLGGRNVTTVVYRTGSPARIDYSDVSGVIGQVASRDWGLRSSVGVPVSAENRLWGCIVVAFGRQELLPADTEHRLAGFTELVATAIANAEGQAALAASRARIVATADQTRRRIERDLHDGAQQRLATLALHLRAAQAAALPATGELSAQLARAVAEANGALEDLRETARGIHPAILARGGLPAALKTLAGRSPIPVELRVAAEGRLPEPVEVSAYYVAAEALTNVARHARATSVSVDVEVAGEVLRVAVRDDGCGGADFSGGTGLVGLKDRVEAIGGRIFLDSPRGAGTSLHVDLPITPANGDVALPVRDGIVSRSRAGRSPPRGGACR